MKKLSSILVLFLSLGLLFSCNNQNGLEDLSLDDSALIEAIQNAEKTEISVDQLPAIAKNTIDGEHPYEFANSAMSAGKLGYEVSLRTNVGVDAGESENVYFNNEGRKLECKKGKRGKGKGKKGKKRKDCFDFEYPVTFTMPDGSTINADDRKSLGEQMKAWFQANPDNREKPELHFPATLIFKDGSSVTVNSEDEMHEIHDACRGEKDGEGRGEKCFKLVFPVSVAMADGTIISGDSKDELHEAVKAWFQANPDADREARPELQFPVEVEMEDGTTKTINSKEEMRELKESCK